MTKIESEDPFWPALFRSYTYLEHLRLLRPHWKKTQNPTKRNNTSRIRFHNGLTINDRFIHGDISLVVENIKVGHMFIPCSQKLRTYFKKYNKNNLSLLVEMSSTLSGP